jgi:hypothetical protein
VYSLVQSDIFTFYVGEEKKPFAVHSTAVANTSESFRALVYGGLVEAKERSAELKDIKPADFVRFLEYAYRRDYKVPSSEPDQHVLAAIAAERQSDPFSYDEPAPPAPPPPVDYSETPVEEADYRNSSRPLFQKKLKVKKRDTTILPPTFDIQQRDYLADGAPNVLLVQECMPISNSEVHEDFTPVFLAHARLYTFADMRLVYPLKNLTLHKLQRTLLSFNLYEERVGDILWLARYAYENGPDRSEEGTLQELSHLVIEYMALEVDTIGKHPEFRALLEEGGEFVTDFWSAVCKYWL